MNAYENAARVPVRLAPACSKHAAHVALVVAYLRSRGLTADDNDGGDLLQQLLELPGRYPGPRLTVARAAALMYISRRTLGRRCQVAGLPNPSRVLAFGRVLHTLQIMLATGWSATKASQKTGWPDPFTFSNAMHRLTGCRPHSVRRRGLIYLAEGWLCRELERGGAALRSPRPPSCPACGQHVAMTRESEEPARRGLHLPPRYSHERET